MIANTRPSCLPTRWLVVAVILALTFLPVTLAEALGEEAETRPTETASERRFLDRLMDAESNGRAYAKNPRSSALGPFQFINSTFLDVAKRNFAESVLGLSDADILQLRTDFEFSRRAALTYTRENAALFTRNGIQPDPANLWLAYLVGPNGALRVLNASPETELSAILSAEAVQANPFMLQMTAYDLIQWSARKVTGLAVLSSSAPVPHKPPRSKIKVRCDQDDPSCEKAMQVLNRMANYLSRARTLSFRAQIVTSRILRSGRRVASRHMSIFLLKRPKTFRILTIARNGAARTGWYDGKKLVIFLRNRNQYMTLTAKDESDDILDQLVDRYQLEIPLVDLLTSKSYVTAAEGTMTAKYIGKEPVAGVACHRVYLKTSVSVWHVWIEASSKPRPHRFSVVSLKQMRRLETLANLNIWRINAATGPKDFVPLLPYRARRVPFRPQWIGYQAAR